MIEMELKALLRNKSAVKKKLEEYGCKWSGVCLQVDTIYEMNNVWKKVGVPIFRIRKCNNEKILTLKMLEEDMNTAKELELTISDDEMMDKMLKAIGFFPKVQVIKRREITKYRGFNICIDEVSNLGLFIEIEKLSLESEYKEKVYSDMKMILAELGVSENDIQQEKYYEMLLENVKGEKNE